MSEKNIGFRTSKEQADYLEKLADSLGVSTSDRNRSSTQTAKEEGNEMKTRTKWNGQKLFFRYTDADDLSVLHYLPMSPGYSVQVVGNPDNGSYEWIVERNGKLTHSDCGYGDSDIALRDGLIEMHGLPSHKAASKDIYEQAAATIPR